MINYSQSLTWEPQLSPSPDVSEEHRKKYIISRIEDFADSISRHGVDSPKIGKKDDDLIDTLYEYIEDNLEKFLPEPTYDT